MLPVYSKPNIDLNYSHTITEYNSVISHSICEVCISLCKNFKRGKSKHEHLWKAQFDSTLITDVNHIIYQTLDNFWNEFVVKTNIKIDFIEYYEVKKYTVGDFFESHRDNYFTLDSKIDRKINLILQLSEKNDYEGGDLLIGSHTVSRNKGTVILFPATYMHEVTKVTSGTRYSLIGHAWGPNWI